jgi:hypothetical protein
MVRTRQRAVPGGPGEPVHYVSDAGAGERAAFLSRAPAEDVAAAPSTNAPDLAARIQDLERLVRDLRTRVLVLERKLALASDHPVDQAVVAEPVRYDWQQ